MCLTRHWVKDSLIALVVDTPDNKIHGANMGPIRGRQDPDGPHVGPTNFVTWVLCNQVLSYFGVWLDIFTGTCYRYMDMSLLQRLMDWSLLSEQIGWLWRAVYSNIFLKMQWHALVFLSIYLFVFLSVSLVLTHLGIIFTCTYIYPSISAKFYIDRASIPSHELQSAPPPSRYSVVRVFNRESVASSPTSGALFFFFFSSEFRLFQEYVFSSRKSHCWSCMVGWHFVC